MRAAVVLLFCLGCPDDPGFSPPPDRPPDPVGQAEVSPDRLDLTGAGTAQPVVGTVVVHNAGERELRMHSAVIDGSRLTLATDETANANRRIEPDGSFDILVTCRFRELPADPAEGALVIATNDPEAARIEVPITCTPAGGDDDGDGD